MGATPETLPPRELDTQPPVTLTTTIHPDGGFNYRFDRTDGATHPTVRVQFSPASRFPNKGFDRMYADGPCYDVNTETSSNYALAPGGVHVEMNYAVEHRRTPEQIEATAIAMAMLVFNR